MVVQPKEKRLFGTDGIRGKANCDKLTAELALKLGMAAGSLFINGDKPHKVIVGKDTRLSGYLFESAITAGFISVGIDVLLVGPMPTPSIAMLTRAMRADIGVMISASHNNYQDNGIKLFGPDGYKLSDNTELAIEERFFSNTINKFLASPDHIAKAKRIDDAPGRYIEYVKNTFPKGKTLDGLKIVVDCANGAAYNLGPTIFWELGADVTTINAHPDGFNINLNCGSNCPEILSNKVLEIGADIGIALDGDADRLVVVDEKGKIVNGDQLIAALTLNLARKNLLNQQCIVTTIMSNYGLEKFLAEHNINLIRTLVGDRYVVEKMRSCGYNFGAEESGHIVFGDYATTGDGLLAAVQLLAILIEQNQPLSEIGNLFTLLPQFKKTIKLKNNDATILERPKLKNIITESEKMLNNQGRLVIRKSGTEPIIRIMAEGENIKLMENIVSNISVQLEKELA